MSSEFEINERVTRVESETAHNRLMLEQHTIECSGKHTEVLRKIDLLFTQQEETKSFIRDVTYKVGGALLVLLTGIVGYLLTQTVFKKDDMATVKQAVIDIKRQIEK
jgi:hypothetical protein